MLVACAWRRKGDRQAIVDRAWRERGWFNGLLCVVCMRAGVVRVGFVVLI